MGPAADGHPALVWRRGNGTCKAEDIAALGDAAGNGRANGTGGCTGAPAAEPVVARARAADSVGAEAATTDDPTTADSAGRTENNEECTAAASGEEGRKAAPHATAGGGVSVRTAATTDASATSLSAVRGQDVVAHGI